MPEPSVTTPQDGTRAPIPAPSTRSPQRFFSGRGAAFGIGLLVCALIAAYSLWYTSAGQFPIFPFIQNDYVDLGHAFLQGQVSLLEQPDPRLASLPNPYEYKERKQIPYHWDASYYEGKYYLYWGPVPAAISALLELIFRTPPSASVLVDLPYIALSIVFLALLQQLSKLFPTAARSTSWLFVLMGLFNLPLLFLIGQPRHYQASIIYGQLFLLSGLLGFSLYTAARKPVWLIISGLGWGLSVACRYNLAISAGIYVVFALLWIRRDVGRDGFWRSAGALLAPLILCALGLGLYNLVRFHNPLETGLAYQLTIPEFQKITYSLAYIPSNLYVYLIYPLIGTGTFPFIQNAHFHPYLLPDWLVIPPNREVDQVVLGIFRTAPVVWLLLLSVPFLALLIRDVRSSRGSPAGALQRHYLLTMVAVGAAGQFLFLMVFFYAAERYVADFYLPLILCLGIIVWRLDEGLRGVLVLRSLLWLSVFGLTAWTAVIGYFGCFGVPTLVSNFYDPRMLAGLASFWNPIGAFFQGLWGAARGLIPA